MATPLENDIKMLRDQISLSSGTTDPIDLIETVVLALQDAAYEIQQLKAKLNLTGKE